MQVTFKELPGRLVRLCTVTGSVDDISAAQDLGRQLSEVISEGCRTLYVDLREAPAMSEDALRVLLRATKKMRESHGSLHLVAPAPALRGALRTTTLDRVIPVHDSLDDVPGATPPRPPAKRRAARPRRTPS
jgi:stage II sporulation protein AA (anti-sigma F factor antagonist)